MNKNITLIHLNIKKEINKNIKFRIYMFIKRFFDILISFAGILIFLPIISMVLYIIHKINDKNKVFYTQTRVGKGGKLFKLYKYQTMTSNSDEILDELLKIPVLRKEWQANQKFEDDPRVTKVGKFLRKTSLDELPQLINVLRGDMSLIGPRPLIVGELYSHKGDSNIYESMKPGISSWWAVNGRSTTTYKKRLELEYYYIKNYNLMLDIKCFFYSIKAVISKKGAK